MLNRRSFTALTFASFVRPLSALDAYDCVIIGAGAAGIFAARECKKLGLNYLVLEASNRIGGRLFTASLEGNIYDAGGAYIHNSSINPFTPLAESLKFKTSSMSFGGGMRFTQYQDGKPLTLERLAFLRATQAKVRETLDDYEGDDKSLAQVIRAEVGENGVKTFRTNSIFALGEEPERVSIKDYNTLESGGNLSVEKGFGALLKALAEGLNIKTNVVVKEIDVSQRIYTLQTNEGVLRTKSVILTPSVGVMQAETIKMPKPRNFLKALEGMQMGSASKIGISTTASNADFENIGFLHDIYESGSKESGRMGYELNHKNQPLIVVNFGGDEARFLLKEKGAAAAHAKARLKLIFGNDIEKKLGASQTHGWWQEPLFRGAYASVKPKYFASRELIREPLHERLFYAGEATAKEYSMTAGGAALEGIRVANLLAQMTK